MPGDAPNTLVNQRAVTGCHKRFSGNTDAWLSVLMDLLESSSKLRSALFQWALLQVRLSRPDARK